jgi:hypothetical protein
MIQVTCFALWLEIGAKKLYYSANADNAITPSALLRMLLKNGVAEAWMPKREG